MSSNTLKKENKQWESRTTKVSTNSNPPQIEFGECRTVELADTLTIMSAIQDYSIFVAPLGDSTEKECPLADHLGVNPYEDCLKPEYRAFLNQFRTVQTVKSKFDALAVDFTTELWQENSEPLDLMDTVLSWTGLNEDNQWQEFFFKTGVGASMDFSVHGIPCDAKYVGVTLPSKYIGKNGKPTSPKECILAFIDKLQFELAEGWGAVVTMAMMAQGLPVLAYLTNGDHCIFVNLTKWYELVRVRTGMMGNRTYHWNEWVAETLSVYGLDNVADTLGADSGERCGFTYRNHKYPADSTHSNLPRKVGDGYAAGPRLRICTENFVYKSGYPLRNIATKKIGRTSLKRLAKACSPVLRVEDVAGWLTSSKKDFLKIL